MKFYENTKILRSAVYFFALLAFVFMYRSCQNKDLAIDIQEKYKKEKQKIIDQHYKYLKVNHKITDSLISSLEQQLEEYKTKKDSIIKKSKDYEKSPSYDIDFITAHRIISESNYRPFK